MLLSEAAEEQATNSIPDTVVTKKQLQFVTVEYARDSLHVRTATLSQYEQQYNSSNDDGTFESPEIALDFQV